MTCPKQINVFLLILVLTFFVSSSASAWSNGGYSANQSSPDLGTHDWIAEAALGLQTKDVTFLTTTYHSEYLLGTEAPDNPDFIGDTTKHHIYYYASHLIQDDVCAERASGIYDTALSFMKAGDFHSAAFDIGVMAHYISDPGVFGHTMGAYTDWGAEDHHQDYENETEKRIDDLSPPTGAALGDSSAYSATLNLGYLITFGGGAIQTNVWMDTNYDWTDETFEASATASLYASISAVAAVINHLLIESAYTPPEPRVPQPPTSLNATFQDSRVNLAWLAPTSDGGAAITGYLVFRATDPSTPTILTNLSNSALNWTDNSPVRGRTNYYWVAAGNSVGFSNLSQMVSVDVPKKADSMFLPIMLSAISIAVASAGVLIWRRRR